MMLKFFRKHSTGPLTKTLMLLLALTFILWGIGDTITRQNKVVAFKVADQEVTYSQWQEALSQQVRAIEIEIGKKLTPEEVAAFGLQKMVLNQLINKMLLEKEANEMGVLVSDDMAKFEISSMPMFIRNGKFDEDAFYRFLNAIGSSEEEFVQQMKSDIAVSSLKLALTLNKEFPKIYTDILSKARSVEKQFDLYTFDRKAIKLADKMTNSDMLMVYEDNKEMFTLPEMRNISYMTLSINNIDNKIIITDEQLQDAYEARKEIYEIPETRSVLQIIFKDKAKARYAHNELKEGQTFIKVAKKFFPKQKNFSLGDKITLDSFDEEIVGDIFDTEKGGFSKIVKSPLGYHIFHIKDIKSARTKSFDEIKAALATQLVMEKKYDEFLTFVQDIEQDSVGVESLAEIAEKYSLKLHSMDSLTPADATNDKNMKRARFADIAFSLPEFSVSNAYPLDEKGNYFILQVLNVKHKEYKSIEVVKSQVQKIWKEKKLRDEFAKVIKVARSQIVNSDNKKSFAVKPTVSKGQVMDWNKAKSSQLPNQLKEDILRSSVGNVTSAASNSDGSKFYIAKIHKITPIETKINSVDLNLELAVSTMEVYLAQYLNYLHGKYDVQVFNIGEVQ